MYLVGWKEAARFIGIHEVTLRQWDKKYLQIPWHRDGKVCSRVRIPATIFELWYKKVRKIRKELDECGEEVLKKKINKST